MTFDLSPVVSAFQSYMDPEDPAVASKGEGVALPLGENTLTHNLGLPVVVVCCKVGFNYRGALVVFVDDGHQ